MLHGDAPRAGSAEAKLKDLLAGAVKADAPRAGSAEAKNYADSWI